MQQSKRLDASEGEHNGAECRGLAGSFKGSTDGREAFGILNEFLEKIGDKPITDYVQLVITDVEMLEMDGLTLTKSIKAHPRPKVLPVIINTSLSGPENRDKAQLVGADGYLVKFDPTLLFKELARFLAA